ncbi:polygalacturonase-like [Tripterygium wilfordii]|uniref:polygalacturonase-like n=1 Tax=Tripterygium wilfordii TaxID=458696 RepID=UPI0018F851E1|nr:polygalacturonase-like [Tripterygium wilfordii]
MAPNTCTIVSFLLALTFSLPFIAFTAQFNVVSYGARPDGKTDSSRALLNAWAQACASRSPSTIYVPQGRFFLGNVVFKGPCKNNAIFLKIDGTLVAPSYNTAHNWIMFRDVDNVAVSGGTLDGQGTSLWACKASGKSCPLGATSLEFSNSDNVVISGLTSLNSQMFHIVINECQNVKIQGVKVSASGISPNTDGIHVGGSTDITILNTMISTGDDCISIGPGTNNLWIENVVCGPGHGISIGSLGKKSQEAGVENVTVTNVQFIGTQNGVRIKSWGRPSNGFARNVLFQNCTMINVHNPVVIDQNYCPNNKNCPGEASGVRVSDVTYRNIQGSSATEVAVKLDCSKKNPCSGIRMEDVKLSFKNKPPQASCVNAGGVTSGFVQPRCL